MASSHTYVLITGANIGLGFGFCQRLIDEFIATRPPSAQLTLICTTRSAQKASDTLRALSARLERVGTVASQRIHLRTELVELTDLLSVKSLARKLTGDAGIPRLDALVLNAGIAGTVGVDWPVAIWQILTENAAAVTWPRFKKSVVGTVTKRQLPDCKDAEPPLGQVFCANVFGHYMLAHWLMPLLRRGDEDEKGRVIWVSSIEAGARHFDESDLQGLRSATTYESSKRVMDLLVLTAKQRATEESLKTFVADAGKGGDRGSARAEMMASQPGIVATGIVPPPPGMMPLWLALAYVIRWIGSPWHTNTAYNGAISTTWLTLASSDEIRNKQQGGTVKWGSVVDRAGNARVEKTDIDGWGIDGSGKSFAESWWGGRWGRTIGATDATKEDVDRFVKQGARVWREMEQLRMEWEARLQNHETEHLEAR